MLNVKQKSEHNDQYYNSYLFICTVLNHKLHKRNFTVQQEKIQEGKIEGKVYFGNNIYDNGCTWKDRHMNIWHNRFK